MAFENSSHEELGVISAQSYGIRSAGSPTELDLS